MYSHHLKIVCINEGVYNFQAPLISTYCMWRDGCSDFRQGCFRGNCGTFSETILINKHDSFGYAVFKNVFSNQSKGKRHLYTPVCCLDKRWNVFFPFWSTHFVRLIYLKRHSFGYDRLIYVSIYFIIICEHLFLCEHSLPWLEKRM